MSLPNWEVRYLKIMETVAWLAIIRLLVNFEDYKSVGLTLGACAVFETVRVCIQRYEAWKADRDVPRGWQGLEGQIDTNDDKEKP